ncbi:MAG: trehalose-phosphatase [Candidatus Paceibacterota bacterium]
MEDVLKQPSDLLSRVRKNGLLLMLDFDGVLSPIVAHPELARMSKRTRELLRLCALRGRVAVISGRALSDVAARVGLANIWYAGNHGAEWRMGKVRGREKHSRSVNEDLRGARDAFTELARHYPGAFVEDKALTLSVHFRLLSVARVRSFKKDVHSVAKRFRQVLDVAEGGEFVFNVRSRTGHTKAFAASLACRLSPARVVPVFIGDDTTDEDVFRTLARGVTIRVGKDRNSAARFFVREREDVDTLLSLLAGAW